MQESIYWNGRDIELPKDFLVWLNVFLPQWELDSHPTGEVYAMYAAFMAGKEIAKLCP